MCVDLASLSLGSIKSSSKDKGFKFSGLKVMFCRFRLKFSFKGAVMRASSYHLDAARCSTHLVTRWGKAADPLEVLQIVI